MTADFLKRLMVYVGHDRRPTDPLPPTRPALWSFVCRDRERLAPVHIQSTVLIVVIEGVKEVTDGRGTHRFTKGSALLFTPGWSGTVVNEPDPACGAYRALVLDFSAELVRRLLRAHPPSAETAHPKRDLRVAFTPALAEAMLHAAAGLTAGLAPRLVEHRCMEVLLALLDEGVWWLGRGIPGSTAEAVRQLVRAHPDRPWTAADLAGEIGTSVGTLRRRLSKEGVALRTLLAEERVAHARHLLEAEGLSVQQAAEACGYTSRSHFARRVRTATGANPSALRQAP
ncbi:helix-turn-helix transcriptional regulator [Azospirillum sp. sgz301742]